MNKKGVEILGAIGSVILFAALWDSFSRRNNVSESEEDEAFFEKFNHDVEHGIYIDRQHLATDWANVIQDSNIAFHRLKEELDYERR